MRANKMYIKGRHFDQAARLAEEMGDLQACSLYHLKGGDLMSAGEIEIRLENREKAAYLFTRGRHHKRAGEVLEELDKPRDAAEQFMKAGETEKAAILYVRAGEHLEAAGLFKRLIEKIGQSEPGSFQSESETANIARYNRYCGELLLNVGQSEDRWKSAVNVEVIYKYQQRTEFAMQV